MATFKFSFFRCSIRSVLLVGMLAAVSACIGDGAELELCVPGARGCECLEGDLPCLDPVLSCTHQRICSDLGCRAGSRDCACAVGNQCELGLVCEASICHHSTVPSAARVHPAECGHNLSCEQGQCAPCAPGSRGCSCDDTVGCSDSQRVSTAVAWSSLVRSSQPHCMPPVTHHVVKASPMRLALSTLLP